jgi:hypothetical protein
MADETTYSGGCHCGRVRFEVTTAIDDVLECNCSICSKTGSLLTFVAPERLRLLSGGDELTDYQFGRRTVHHLFCPACGIRSFARGRTPDGRERVAINVRCLDGVEPGELPVRKFDGRSL